MSKPDITAVVLTLNEEANIARCLNSLGWTRSAIVLDSGSQDRTREIAREGGADVLVHRQDGPFDIAEQRNWILDSGGIDTAWILFLDADEVVPGDLQDHLTAISNSSSTLDAYELTPKYLFRGQWMRRTMNFPNYHPRFLRSTGPRFSGGVWEHFTNVGTVGRVELPYLHFGNSKGFAEWVERHNRYSSWEAENVSNYLETRNVSSFRTDRRLALRAVAARFWRLRPLLRFMVMYVGRLGFLDGRHAFAFCIRYAIYEYMITEKVRDLRISRSGGVL